MGLASALFRVARIIPVAVTAVFGLVHLTPLIPWATRQITVWDPQPVGGVLVVLGAEQQSDGTIGVISYWRCVYAAQTWRAGKFSHVVVSGGASNRLEPPGVNAPPPKPLAEVMGDFLVAIGVPRSAILVEPSSSSTHLNAVYSVELLREMTGPFTVITSDYHSYRAQRCFRRAGLAVASWPVPDILKRFSSWRDRFHCGTLLVEEFIKLGYYSWKGWI